MILPQETNAEVMINFYKFVASTKKFVADCAENYTPGVRCTDDERILGLCGKCCFKQYITNKQSNVGLNVHASADKIFFDPVSSKIYARASADIPGLPEYTQAAMDLIQRILETNRNINTDNITSLFFLSKH